MALDAPLQLLFALSDLKLVQSVTGAINANLPKTGPLGTIPAGAQANGSLDHNNAVLTPEKSFARRDVFHPSPEYALREVFHPAPLYEEPVYCRPALEPCGRAVDTNYDVPRSRSPIQPPWRVRPWEQPPAVCVEVKIVVVRPDILSKGTLLDLFI